MTHALHQALERCSRLDLPPSDLLEAAQPHLCLPGSNAIRLFVLPAQVHTSETDASNGNTIWAIIRDHHLVTLMLRRTNQPSTPAALRVDHVLYA